MKRSLLRVSWGLAAAALAAISLALLPASKALAYPGADNLSIQQSCEPGNQVQVVLTWTNYNMGSQWVDVSLLNNNFAPGTYLSAGPLAANANFISVKDAQTSTTFYARINTQTSTGYYPSSTIQFQTLSDCSSTVIVPVPAPAPVIVPIPVPAPIPAPIPVPLPVPVPGSPPPMVNPLY